MTTFHPRLLARAFAAGLCLAALSTAAQSGEFTSSLQIEAGQTFELGGGQEGGFAVTGKNTGPVAVVVLGRLPGAQPVARGTVAPGDKVDAVFAPGEMALLRNTSTQQTARMKLKVTGDTASLGMTYSDNR